MKKMTRITALLLAALLLAALCGCGPKEPAESRTESQTAESCKDQPDGRPFAVIEIELRPDIAPITVANFIELAESGFNGAVAPADQPVIARITIEYR